MATTPVQSDTEGDDRDRINYRSLERNASIPNADLSALSEDSEIESATSASEAVVRRTQKKKNRKPIPTSWEVQDEIKPESPPNPLESLDISQILSQITTNDHLQRKEKRGQLLGRFFEEQNNSLFSNISFSTPSSLPVSSSSLTNWSQEFNLILDGTTNTPNESLLRFQKLECFLQKFERESQQYAKQIIEERIVSTPFDNSPTMKDGLLLEFLTDKNGEESEIYLKWWRQEVKSLSSLLTCCIDKLYFPLISIIRYSGFSVRILGLVPISTQKFNNTCILSSTVLNSSPVSSAAEAILVKVGRLLNLRSHSIVVNESNGSQKRRRISTSFESQIHQGTDGRFYLLPSKTLLPPLQPKEQTDIFSKRFRPEFSLGEEKYRLSSDSFSNHQSNNNNEASKLNSECKEAEESLIQSNLEKFIKFWDKQQEYRLDRKRMSASMELPISLLENAEELVEDLHAEGINLCFLGFVASKSSSPSTVLLAWSQMTARIAFKSISLDLRKKLLSGEKKERKEIVCKSLERIFKEKDSKFWEQELFSSLKSSFRFPSDFSVPSSILDLIHFQLVFQLVSRKLGIEWKDKDSKYEAKETNWVSNFLKEDQIGSILPQSQTIRPLSQGSFVSKLRTLMGLPESSYCLRSALMETSIHQPERIFILQQLATFYSENPKRNANLAQQYYQEMVSLIQRQSGNYGDANLDEPIQILGLLSVSDHFFNLSKFREAENFLTKAKEISEKFGSMAVGSGLLGSLASSASSSRNRSASSTPNGSLKGEMISVTPEQVLKFQMHGLVLARMARLKKMQGDYKSAENLSLSATKRFNLAGSGLTKGTESGGNEEKEPLETSYFFTGLAMVHFEMKRPEEAEKLLKRALDMAEKSFGVQHPKVTGCLYDVGLLLIRQGHFAEAEQILRRSLILREMSANSGSSASSFHSLLAQNLHALAFVSSSKGNYEESAQGYLKAYQVLSERYSPLSVEPIVSKKKMQWISLLKVSKSKNEPSSLSSLNLSLHNEEENSEKSLTQDWSLEGFLCNYFAQQIDVGRVYDDLAVSYHKLGMLDKADAAQLRSISFRQNSLFYSKGEINYTLNCMGELESSKGNYSKAREYYERALINLKEIQNQENPLIFREKTGNSSGISMKGIYRYSLLKSDLVYNIGQMDYRSGDQENAKKKYEESLLSIKNLLPSENNPETVLRIHSLGYLATTAGKYEEGKELYLKALEMNTSLFGDSHPESASIKNDLAWVYFKMGNLLEAEQHYQQSLLIRRKFLGEEHPDTARSLHEAAELYTVQGKFVEAESYNKKALQIREKVLGRGHVDVARSKHNLASLYLAQGKYSEAENLVQSSIEILVKALSETHAKLGTSYHLLGKIYYRQGKHEAAEKAFNKSLEIFKIHFKGDHPDVAQTLHSLGYLYATKGQYSSAETYYSQSRDMMYKCFGPEHPEAAQSCNNLAWIYFRQSKFQECQELYEQSLKTREASLGPHHIDVARSLHDLAELFIRLGQTQKARELTERALSIRRKVFGNAHPDVARSISQLGDLLFAEGNYTDSERCQREALQILVGKLGDNHPKVAEVIHLLAKLFHKQGKYTQSEGLYLQSLKMRENSLGKEHPDTAISMEDLAYLWTSQAKYPAALELYSKARQIVEKTFGESHPQVAVLKSNIAWIYFKQGKYVEAEELYKQSLILRENLLGKEHPEVARSCVDLAELYVRIGKYGEAEEFNARSLVIRNKLYSQFHSDVNRSLSQKAIIFFYRGRYEEAETTQESALKNLESKLGSNHPKVASAMHELARIYFKQGKYDEAESYFKRSLAIRQTAYGDATNHPDVAESYSTMGYLYGTWGMYKISAEHYRNALAILNVVFGSEEHLEIVSLNSSLAWIIFKQGGYEEAEKIYKRSLAIREKLLGKLHPDVARSCHELSELYQKKEQFQEAEVLSQRALSIRESVLGKNHVDVAKDLESLAEVAIAQKNFSVAEGYLQRALSILVSNLGEEHGKVAQAEQAMGALLEKQSLYDRAEERYRKALAIRKKALGATHPTIAESLHALANVCALQKRHQEAEKLYSESVAILKSRLGVSHPDVAALVKDYDKFLLEEEKEALKAEASPAIGAKGWGSMIAVGLISTAVFAMQKLSNR